MPDTRKKILIIEDNDDQRVMMKVALEHGGYVVNEAVGAQQGLLYAELGDPQLILLDLTLVGRVDGWEVLSRLQATAKTASIPVIIMSALWDEEYIQRSRAAGAVDYLTKPFPMDELLMRVKRTLASAEDADQSG